MAIYRAVHTSFWQDTYVLDLTPDEKYFYLYIMTNTKTNLSGIYEISLRTIELETGLTRETINQLIRKFVDDRKIDFCEQTNEMMIINWLKYNSVKSPKLFVPFLNELKLVKNQKFLEKIKQILIGYGYSIDRVSEIGLQTVQYSNSTETVTETVTVQEQYSDAATFLEQNFCKTLSSSEIQNLYTAIDEFNLDIVKLAISETVLNDVRAWKYTQSILDRWKTVGVKTIEQARLQTKKFKKEDKPNSNKQIDYDNQATF